MWQTILGQTLYQSKQGVCVKQNLFYRWLTVQTQIIQTCIHRYHPEYPALPYLPFFIFPSQISPGDTCLLGLGGAGVAHALNRHPFKTKLLAVEINQEIIEVAARFFMTKKLKHLRIQHQDAHLFLQVNRHRFKHILVDLFTESAFPNSCKNHHFFELCRAHLELNGILMVNIPSREEQWPIFDLISDVFSKRTMVFVVPKSENILVMAINNGGIDQWLDIIRQNYKLKSLIWDLQWGYLAQ